MWRGGGCTGELNPGPTHILDKCSYHWAISLALKLCHFIKSIRNRQFGVFKKNWLVLSALFFIKVSASCKTLACVLWPTSWTSSAICPISAVCTEVLTLPRWGPPQCAGCSPSPGASSVLCTPQTEHRVGCWTTWLPHARLSRSSCTPHLSQPCSVA